MSPPEPVAEDVRTDDIRVLLEALGRSVNQALRENAQGVDDRRGLGEDAGASRQPEGAGWGA